MDCLRTPVTNQLWFFCFSVFVLYRISYMWYSAIGLLITVITGVLVSWCTGFDDPCRVHADLLSPPFRRFYSRFSNHTKERLHIPIEVKLWGCLAWKRWRVCWKFGALLEMRRCDLFFAKDSVSMNFLDWRFGCVVVCESYSYEVYFESFVKKYWSKWLIVWANRFESFMNNWINHWANRSRAVDSIIEWIVRERSN